MLEPIAPMRFDDETASLSPPAPFRLTSPYALELREGGGGKALLGLPFFVAGICLALAVAGVVPVEPEPTGKWAPVVLGLMSVAFLGVGSTLLFGRRRLTLDLTTRFLTRRTSVLIPIRSEERSLDHFTAVVIAFDSGDSDSPDRYPVKLRALTGKDFTVSSPAQFSDSRNQAEYLSRYLRLPLADTITDHETVVSPERACDPLQKRLVSGEVAVERTVAPPDLRCEVNTGEGHASIVIPGGSLLAGGFAVLMPVLVFLVVIPAILRFVPATPGGFQSAPLFFVILFLGIPSIFICINQMVAGNRKRTSVEASPTGLVIERRSGWRTRTTVIAAADILDLDYSTVEGIIQSAKSSSLMVSSPVVGNERLFALLKSWIPTKGIVVKSRQGLTTFGEGLSAGELQYLKSILRKALAGR